LIAAGIMLNRLAAAWSRRFEGQLFYPDNYSNGPVNIGISKER